MSVEPKPHPTEVLIESLKQQLQDKDTQIERLTLRVLSKDEEFAKERRLWARKERALKEQIKAARKVNR